MVKKNTVKWYEGLRGEMQEEGLGGEQVTELGGEQVKIFFLNRCLVCSICQQRIRNATRI